jgi:ABC-type multidrug transport system ATPase subunit
LGNALKIENLNFTYKNPPKILSYLMGKKSKEVVAIEGINLSLEKGETLAIMGKNGAGKTTLLKIIVGLLKEDSGKIEVFGNPPEAEETKKVIGFAQSDERSFYYRLSVRDNLFFFGQLWGKNPKFLKKKIGELAEILKIDSFIDEVFFELSSGMKQKVSIARALLHDPKILLLDEPTRSLDLVAQEEVKNILKSEYLKEKTLIVSTHKTEEAKDIAERSIILKEGKIIYDGKPVSDEEKFKELVEGERN